jgi:alpha-L-fucosidase 2
MPMNGKWNRRSFLRGAGLLAATIFTVRRASAGSDQNPVLPPISLFSFGQPATEWVDGFPLGNGLLGAMVLGGVKTDRIALNHNQLWRRAVKPQDIRVAGKLPEFRRLFQAGHFDEAGRLMEQNIMQTGGKRYAYVNPFQPLGDLWLDFLHNGDAVDYRRQLDMDVGIAEVSYRDGDVRFRREYFISAPEDNVLVIRITSDRSGAISGQVRLDRTERDDAVRTQERFPLPKCSIVRQAAGNHLILSARFEEGFPFAAVAGITSNSGRLTPEGSAIRIQGASEVLIVTAMATGVESSDPVEWSRKHLAGVGLAFDKLRQKHVVDHQRLFRRVRLSLQGSEPNQPTDQLVENAVQTQRGSPALFEKLFDFGRYLLISGSRPDGLPMNLQGIWNDQVYPPWDSDYHLDLNLQCNYWPAEVANLSELHQPLFDWAEARIPEARRMARDLFGCRGIYFPIVADATGLGNPDNLTYSWPGAAGWLAHHFWQHWEYTGNREFLAHHAYPFLKEVAAFYLDYLNKDSRGKYVLIPSASPENGIKGRNGWTHFTTISSTIDLEIAHEVFTHLIAGSHILKLNDDQLALWQQVLKNLPEPGVNEEGRLREWSEDVEEADPGHRHLSPLYGLFPGDRIVTSGSPDLVSAARKLLEYRLEFGAGSANGWSFPWRATLFARLLEADQALAQLDQMARCCVNDNLLSLVTDWRGQGTTINWFGRKKVFQVEANLGITAAIAEMLLQSQGGLIRILPALPARWPVGNVAGLVAQGGFVIDVHWNVGRARRVKIHSRLGRQCRIKVDAASQRIVVMREGRPVPYETQTDGIIGFPTTAGEDYQLTLAPNGSHKELM